MESRAKPEINGLVFYPVPEFDKVNQAFGADERAFFNRYDRPKVPSKFEDIAQDLFFSGGKLPKLSPKIDEGKAMAAINAWLASWAPAHEAKISTVAYALWLWTDDKALAEVGQH